MNLLRARVHHDEKRGWWELRLIDLAVVADGCSETEMLKQLEHALISEYRLAIKFGKTPFVNLFRGAPEDVCRAWQDGDKQLRSLDLPEEVSQALAAVFRAPQLVPFGLQKIEAA